MPFILGSGIINQRLVAEEGGGDAPGAVSGLTVQEEDETSLYLEFTGASDAEYHEARITPTGKGWWRAPVTVVNEGFITGLMPKTTYDVQVRGVNSEGVGPWSSTDSAETTTMASTAYATGSSANPVSEDPLITGMLWGLIWEFTDDIQVITFSFPESGSVYPYSHVSVTNFNNTFNTAMKNCVRHHFEMLESFINIKFIEMEETSEDHADIRFGCTSYTGSGTTAWAYSPTNVFGPSIGDVFVVGYSYFEDPVPGNYAWIELAHEIGHSLGLKHGHQNGLGVAGYRPRLDTMDPTQDFVENTIMSYRNSPFASTGNIGHLAPSNYPQTYMVLDIPALQFLYGANTAHCSGDTVHRWDETTGVYYINDVQQMPNPVANTVFQTLYDPAGEDTLDLTNFGSPDTSNLATNGQVKTDNAQIATLNGSPTFANANVHVTATTDIENVNT